MKFDVQAFAIQLTIHLFHANTEVPVVLLKLCKAFVASFVTLNTGILLIVCVSSVIATFVLLQLASVRSSL